MTPILLLGGDYTEVGTPRNHCAGAEELVGDISTVAGHELGKVAGKRIMLPSQFACFRTQAITRALVALGKRNSEVSPTIWM